MGKGIHSEKVQAFCDALRARLRKGCQREVAEKLGVCESTIHYWLRGHVSPSLSRLLDLCRLLNCTPNDLLGFSAKPSEAAKRCSNPYEQEQAEHLRQLAAYDWVVAGRSDFLHAVKSGNFDDGALIVDVTLACGRKYPHASVPGVFSRMGMTRCKKCCRARGFPEGVGSPKNDNECRRLLGLYEEAAMHLKSEGAKGYAIRERLAALQQEVMHG